LSYAKQVGKCITVLANFKIITGHAYSRETNTQILSTSYFCQDYQSFIEVGKLRNSHIPSTVHTFASHSA